jgi:hypothetical protein
MLVILVALTPLLLAILAYVHFLRRHSAAPPVHEPVVSPDVEQLEQTRPMNPSEARALLELESTLTFIVHEPDDNRIKFYANALCTAVSKQLPKCAPGIVVFCIIGECHKAREIVDGAIRLLAIPPERLCVWTMLKNGTRGALDGPCPSEARDREYVFSLGHTINARKFVNNALFRHGFYRAKGAKQTAALDLICHYLACVHSVGKMAGSRGFSLFVPASGAEATPECNPVLHFVQWEEQRSKDS